MCMCRCPAYTDYLKAFPGRGFTVSGEQIPTVGQVDAALDSRECRHRLQSAQPDRRVAGPERLDRRRQTPIPRATLVVDESYINFTSDPIEWSTLGCGVPNLVVLRSTSKFYGIAATRAGVAWCADDEPLKRLFGQQENWGLSGVDVHVVCAAVRDFHWATHSRAWMRRRQRLAGRHAFRHARSGTSTAMPTFTSSTASVNAPTTWRRPSGVTASGCVCSASLTVFTRTRYALSRHAPMNVNASSEPSST